MKLLILHRIPYAKINYHLGIDHDRHEVVYFGTREALATIPEGLSCRRIERPGKSPISEEALAHFGMSSAEQWDRVISLSEYELLDAARLREAWGVPGPSLESATLVRDKVRMKAAVESAGLRIPRFMDAREALALVERLPWSGRTVIKPRDGASSEGVRVFDRMIDAVASLRELDLSRRTAELDRLEVEEFVEGPILHIDGLVEKGQVRAILASEYMGTCLDYVSGKPLGSYQLEPSAELFEWASRCLKAVRLGQGSFHLEAILSQEGPVFLEVANRVGGADVVDTFEMATGINLPAEELKLILGEPLRATPQVPGKRFGWFVFPGHQFEAGSCVIRGADSLRSTPGVVRWNELAAGKPLPRKVTYQAVEVPVSGVLSGDSSEAVRDLMARIFAEVRVEQMTA